MDDDLSREWNRRAQGKYGNALMGEALAFMGDVMAGVRPRLDVREFVSTIAYKDWRIEALTDYREGTWRLLVRSPNREYRQMVLDPAVDIWPVSEAERLIEQGVYDLITEMEAREREAAFTVGGRTPAWLRPRT